MRIVTWNSFHGKSASKLSRLETLHPDFAVLTEFTRPHPEDSSLLWFGDKPMKGIAAIASPAYTIIPVPARETPPYYIPLFVKGPQSFFVIAVWSQKKSLYVEAILRALHAFHDLIEANPTVVLGDFNSNAVWDKKHSSGRNHTALVALCKKLGLVSAYHQFFNEEQGKETRATLYFHRRQARPYHIDYCFIPEAWTQSLTSVQVGTYSEWADASDHCPLIVDLVFPKAFGAPS
ncbi:MAG: hypothetical protein ABJA83_14485 [Burkholderiaceae bacterium]